MIVERRETIGVTVIDSNGVMIQDSETIRVASQLVFLGKGVAASASYGTESPREPNFAVDRVGWQNGMGTPGGGGGTQVFAWLVDNAWPGDFIVPKPPGTSVATPWVNGDADVANCGIDTAAIVLNDTDGWAQGFDSSQPGATNAEYATAQLYYPSSPGGTVATNLLNGNTTATTQFSSVDYNASCTSREAQPIALAGAGLLRRPRRHFFYGFAFSDVGRCFRGTPYDDRLQFP